MTSLERWLDSVGPAQYAAALDKHGIDWDVSPRLNDDLLKDVGVNAAGDRFVFSAQ